MKDLALNPVLQAILCFVVAAGCFVLGSKFPSAGMQLNMLGSAAMALPVKLPSKAAVAPLLVLAFLGVSASACSPASRQVQLNVAEVATQAANEFGQGILQMYQLQIGKCVADASTEMDYTICKMAVDQVWGPVRLRYASLRRVQDEYATALEKHDVNANDFIQWFRVAYCEAKADAPPELVLPPIPGIDCPVAGAAQ